MGFEACEQIIEGNFSGNMTELIAQCPFARGFTGGMLGGAAVALGIFIITLVLAIFYIYTSLAWQTVARKLKHKAPWLAWIPFARTAMILQLGGFHWAWIFLVLIPILGWIALGVLGIIARWRIFVKRKYPGWFSLAVIIPEIGGILHLIAIGFLAWGNGNKKGKKRK